MQSARGKQSSKASFATVLSASEGEAARLHSCVYIPWLPPGLGTASVQEVLTWVQELPLGLRHDSESLVGREGWPCRQSHTYTHTLPHVHTHICSHTHKSPFPHNLTITNAHITSHPDPQPHPSFIHTHTAPPQTYTHTVKNWVGFSAPTPLLPG